MASWSGAAEPNEAEKLFRDMEKKVTAAKTLEVHFDLTVALSDKTGKLTGTVILGDGDKLRIEAEGDPIGKPGKFLGVSDGTNMFTDESVQKQKREKTDKGIGEFLRGSLAQQGFFISLIHLKGFSDEKANKKTLTDFKLVGKEKVGTRDTQVIEWSVKENDKEAATMKLWLDAKTNLPVKLVWNDAKIKDTITETYSEFTIDPKVDAKKFELPKE